MLNQVWSYWIENKKPLNWKYEVVELEMFKLQLGLKIKVDELKVPKVTDRVYTRGWIGQKRRNLKWAFAHRKFNWQLSSFVLSPLTLPPPYSAINRVSSVRPKVNFRPCFAHFSRLNFHQWTAAFAFVIRLCRHSRTNPSTLWERSL